MTFFVVYVENNHCYLTISKKNAEVYHEKFQGSTIVAFRTINEAYNFSVEVKSPISNKTDKNEGVFFLYVHTELKDSYYVWSCSVVEDGSKTRTSVSSSDIFTSRPLAVLNAISNYISYYSCSNLRVVTNDVDIVKMFKKFTIDESTVIPPSVTVLFKKLSSINAYIILG